MNYPATTKARRLGAIGCAATLAAAVIALTNPVLGPILSIMWRVVFSCWHAPVSQCSRRRYFESFTLAVALPADVPVAKAVQVLKANSSRRLHEHGMDFAWQEGYCASA